MDNIGSIFGVTLLVGALGSLIYGSIAMLVYLIVSKIKKRKLNKKVIFKMYAFSFAICGALILFVSLFVPKTSSKQSIPPQVNPIINLLPLIIIIGIILFIRSVSAKRKYGVSTSQITSRRIKEIKCTCQACGNVWYYGKKEYWDNKGQRMINAANEMDNVANDLLCCGGCLPAAFLPRKQGKEVRDLNKCNKCNSSAVKKEEVIYEV